MAAELDNMTPITFINRMGGTHSTVLLDLAESIWERCLDREITIHVEHLPGTLNVQADWESHHIINDTVEAHSYVDNSEIH